MLGGEVFDCFLREAPVCVMARATLEKMFAAEMLDELFRTQAQRQYQRELLFSSIVDVMSLVVAGMQPSVHAAYRRRREELGVSIQSLYNKINGMEPSISQALVRQTAGIAADVIRDWKPRSVGLKGYRLKVVDGNHLTGTDHRLSVLRDEGGAALPGVAVAVLLPDTGLIDDIVLAEDAYTQESRLLDPIVERLERRDLLLADRHYCISELLFEVDSRQACFVIRQHLGHLRWKLLGRRRSLGRTQSGLLYEQAVELTLPRTGEVMQVRRITVRLDQPTRNKDTELHVLTNLPEKHASAEQVAELYRRRWSIETAFQELTVSLRCELPSLGHPAAALFTFSVAAACFNVLAVIQAALAQAHDTQTIADEVSQYALAEEWTGTYRGMMIALPPEMWTAIQQWSPSELATQLIHWATTIDLSDYRKHQRGPKTRTKRPSAPTKHVATARLLKKQKPPPG